MFACNLIWDTEIRPERWEMFPVYVYTTKPKQYKQSGDYPELPNLCWPLASGTAYQTMGSEQR